MARMSDSEDGSDSAQETIDELTDYYKLLGVDENANQAEIKKCYRKAAMKWHPDRNHDNIEEATRIFQLIEHAYSVLSDPQDKAWYDSHRGFQKTDDGEFVATKVDLYHLFNAGAYRGFGDGQTEFFAVYRKAFRTLAEEENVQAPGFGKSDSQWADVEAFYAFWTCFTTKRSFAFNDIYQPKEAPNSMYRRYFNKENEKARQKAEREFVSTVRQLATFIRKRDPRIAVRVQQLEQEKAQREKFEEQKKAQRLQKLQEELSQYQNESKIEYTEEDLRYVKEFGDEEKENDTWRCEYCDKTMRNESAFRAHCATKKHSKSIQAARNDFINGSSSQSKTPLNCVLFCLDNVEAERVLGKPIDLALVSLEEKEEPKAEAKEETKEEVRNEEEEEEEDQPKKKTQLTKKQKRDMKKQKDQLRKERMKQKETQIKGPVVKEKSVDSLAQENITKKEKKLRDKLERIVVDDESVPDEDAEILDPKKQQQGPESMPKDVPKKDLPNAQVTEEEEKADATEEEDEIEEQSRKKKNKKGIPRPPTGGQFMCKKCRARFASKNQLFKHLQESGHAVFRE